MSISELAVVDWLLVLQDLIDDGFAAFIHGNDFVDRDIAAG